jgi:hypothetical protein
LSLFQFLTTRTPVLAQHRPQEAVERVTLAGGCKKLKE